MKKFIAAAAVAAIATLSLAGCANAEDRARASIKADFLKASAEDTTMPKFDDKAASCVSDSIVTKVGVSQLQTYGLIDSKGNETSKDLDQVKFSDKDATAFAGALFTCSPAMLTAFRSEVDKELPSSLSAAAKDCINKAMTADFATRATAAEMSNNTKASNDLMTKELTPKITACLK